MKFLPPHLKLSNFKTKYKSEKLKIFFKKILFFSLRRGGLINLVFIAILTFVLFFTGVKLVQGQNNQIQLLAPLPGIETNVIDFGPGEFINRLYQLSLGIAGILAMLMIIWGAIEYTISGAIDKKSDAKDRITQAILGLVLLLATVLILNTISPDLTNFQDIIPKL